MSEAEEAQQWASFILAALEEYQGVFLVWEAAADIAHQSQEQRSKQ